MVETSFYRRAEANPSEHFTFHCAIDAPRHGSIKSSAVGNFERAPPLAVWSKIFNELMEREVSVGKSIRDVVGSERLEMAWTLLRLGREAVV